MSKRKQKSKEVADLHSISVEISPEKSELVASNIPESLASIRAEALKTDTDVRGDLLQIRLDTAHTIAELEAWRDEIDRTIAFLKARR
jgi:hypothetical protein